MSINIKNKNGTISLSTNIFANILKHILLQQSLFGKVWPATKQGKLIELYSSNLAHEYSDQMDIENENNMINTISFPVIIKFGESIDKITSLIAEYTSNTIAEKLGLHVKKIEIHVVGLRLSSGRVVQRDVRVVKNGK